MKRLQDLVLRAQPGTGLQFRPRAYRPNTRQFLMDLIAMANASTDGPRYIVVGVHIEDKSRRRLRSVSEDDFHRSQDDLQKLTVAYTEKIEEVGQSKEEEILEV